MSTIHRETPQAAALLKHPGVEAYRRIRVDHNAWWIVQTSFPWRRLISRSSRTFSWRMRTHGSVAQNAPVPGDSDRESPGWGCGPGRIDRNHSRDPVDAWHAGKRSVGLPRRETAGRPYKPFGVAGQVRSCANGRSGPALRPFPMRPHSLGSSLRWGRRDVAPRVRPTAIGLGIDRRRNGRREEGSMTPIGRRLAITTKRKG